MTGLGPGGLGGRSRGAYSDLLGGGQEQELREPDLTTTAGRVAENEARTRRNEEKQGRRDAGEEGVEANEELLELGPAPGGLPTGQEQQEQMHGAPTGVPPLLMITPEQMTEMVAAAAMMEGPQADRLISVLKRMVGAVAGVAGGPGTKTTGLVASTGTGPAPLIGDAPGRKMFEEDDVVADPRLGLVLSLGHHLPLTVCTPDALEDVAEGRKKIEMNTWTGIDNKKKAVVDVDKWPDEKEISSSDWKDAWPNLLKIMEGHVQPAVIDKFRKHFEYLKKQQRFEDRFPGFLRFDTSIRRRYFLNHRHLEFTVGSPEYRQELVQTCHDETVKMVRVLSEWVNMPRFHPYNRDGRAEAHGDSRGDTRGETRRDPRGGAVRGEAVGGARPFQRGRSPTSAGLLCLICGRSGHKAEACVATKTVKGRDTHAVWADGKLIAVSGRAELCIRWNARGAQACSSQRCLGAAHGGGHTCSICGSADHHAGGRRCV